MPDIRGGYELIRICLAHKLSFVGSLASFYPLDLIVVRASFFVLYSGELESKNVSTLVFMQERAWCFLRC